MIPLKINIPYRNAVKNKLKMFTYTTYLNRLFYVKQDTILDIKVLLYNGGSVKWIMVTFN